MSKPDKKLKTKLNNVATNTYNIYILNKTMWSIQKTCLERKNGDIKSAIQKFIRRGKVEETVQLLLELWYSGSGLAAIRRLMVIAVEDCFPSGASIISRLYSVVKKWKTKAMTPLMQRNYLSQFGSQLAVMKKNRHVAYLARVALFDSRNDKEHDNPERFLAKKAEDLVLKIPKPSEMPSQRDIKYDEGMKQLRSLVGPLTDLNDHTLFTLFEKGHKEAKTTSRLYLYTLVAKKFIDRQPRAPIVSSKWMNAPELKLIELPDYVFDKHTSEGKKRKRGLKHFLEEGAKIHNEHETVQAGVGIKRKAEEIYYSDEKLYGTKKANSVSERKRIRETFSDLTEFMGQKVIASELCQKPCGNKPKSRFITLEDNTELWVKGPFKKPDKMDFQIEIDRRKEQNGIIKMDIKQVEDHGLFFLVVERDRKWQNMSSSKIYSETTLWNLVKVLIFRSAFNISDTNFRNVMVSDSNEILSIDEMTPNRMPPRGERLVDYLFNKPPKKFMCDQIMAVIRKRRSEFEKEVKKYGDLTKKLIVGV